MSHYPMLVSEKGGMNIVLNSSPLKIGRRDVCDVVLDHTKISGMHAVLTLESGSWRIRDTRTRNGIKVNGKRLRSGVPHELANNDSVALADLEYRFTD